MPLKAIIDSISKVNNMKVYKKFKAEFQNLRVLIEEDFVEVGWQMYVYKNGKDIYDNVQDTLLKCQEEALEEFGITIESWKEVLE